LAPDSKSRDLFVAEAHHVMGLVCAVAIPDEITVRLDRGLAIRGRVVDSRSRPVSVARVTARPAPGTPPVPGHRAASVTNEAGDFTLEGLIPGNLTIDVDHPHFVLSTSGPYDPAQNADVTIALTPALRATLNVRSGDGRPVKNATLQWRTTGPTAKSELLLLLCEAVEVKKGEKGAEITCSPVKIPCDAPEVVLEVKADGYAPWTSRPEPLNPDGEDRTFEVTLSNDANLGSVKVLLEDEAGQPIPWTDSKSRVTTVIRLDGPPAAAGYVLEGAADLRFPAMPQGRYRILMVGPKFAPASADADVQAGRETEVRVPTKPPAKVRVRFTSPDQVVVRFRVTQGGKTIYAAPEGVVVGTEAEDKEPIYSAGADGLLLSGLATGTYAIEVSSDEVTAPPTTVRLEEGQTEEIEIEVRRR
jgi:hypothetical protein